MLILDDIITELMKSKAIIFICSCFCLCTVHARQKISDYDILNSPQAFNKSDVNLSLSEKESGVSDEDWDNMKSKLSKLPVSDYPSMKRSDIDWLLSPYSYKAEVKAGSDGKFIVISNGLIARVFRIIPNLATIDIVNQMSGENMLRAVSSEGEITVDGKTWHLGGLEGQPERGYLKLDWIDAMTVADHSFIVKDFEVSDSIHSLEWAKKRWALNKELPTGKSLTFTMYGTEEMSDIRVKLHFDIYDNAGHHRQIRHRRHSLSVAYY